MPVYYLISYDIIDMDEYKNYGPKVLPLLAKYGAKVLASDMEGIAMEGTPRNMNAIIKFPSKETALQCYHDPEYQPMKTIRIRSTANCTMTLVKEFEGE